MGGKYSANVCHANNTAALIFKERLLGNKWMFIYKLIRNRFIKINLFNFVYLLSMYMSCLWVSENVAKYKVLDLIVGLYLMQKNKQKFINF